MHHPLTPSLHSATIATILLLLPRPELRLPALPTTSATIMATSARVKRRSTMTYPLQDIFGVVFGSQLQPTSDLMLLELVVHLGDMLVLFGFCAVVLLQLGVLLLEGLLLDVHRW